MHANSNNINCTSYLKTAQAKAELNTLLMISSVKENYWLICETVCNNNLVAVLILP
jgi:hypothetical protein